MIYKQQKKNGGSKGGGGGGGRLLISITVLGSAGPIRFVVNEGQLVGAVIETTLKSYAREGRLPVLGSDLDDFVLYCPIAGNEGIYISTVANFISCVYAHKFSIPSYFVSLDLSWSCVWNITALSQYPKILIIEVFVPANSRLESLGPIPSTSGAPIEAITNTHKFSI